MGGPGSPQGSPYRLKHPWAVERPGPTEQQSTQQGEGLGNSTGMEQMFAWQLQVEKQERDRAISLLRARLEELTTKVQDLHQHSWQQQQLVPVVTPCRSAPFPGAKDGQPRDLESVASIAEHVGFQVSKFEGRINALLEEINESNMRVRSGPTSLDSALESAVLESGCNSKSGGPNVGGSLAAPIAAATDAIALLQTGIKDLDVKLQQHRDDISHIKTALVKVLNGMPMNTIFDLASNEAQSAFDIKERDYKPFLHKQQPKRPVQCQSSPDVESAFRL